MILVLPLLFACIADDWNGRPYTGPGTGAPKGGVGSDTGDVPVGDGLTGSWVSQGADLSELLADSPFFYVRVDASFTADGSFEVVGEDQDGTLWPSTGIADAVEGSPGPVTLEQDQPYVATAVGLWQIDGNTLTWEVVQTLPNYGFQPPTPGSGFGSSTGPGLAPGVNVQTFQRTQ